MKVDGSLEPARQSTGEINLSTAFLMPGLYIPEHTQQSFRGMLVDDALSSHDLRNLCPTGDVMFDEHVPKYSWTNLPCSNGSAKDKVPLPVEKMP
ncbi:hypothetical protein CQW23_32077 [Capsicum baccatum]|uniref:Uncharacterized protein n=1 Tax=Capsicum baccatum TaxID=33114 RepID=A0A2G2V5R1_CAPBA|nr:hypothetical protein CQW23_32077 [Capsicum baccatum]